MCIDVFCLLNIIIVIFYWDPNRCVTSVFLYLVQQRKKRCRFAGGLQDDLRRRIPHYWADFRDGVVGDKTIQKVISTTLFLYFASILPAIAFGVLNDHNTQGKIGKLKFGTVSHHLLKMYEFLK